ncbi:MAG: hypothetical protein PHG53_09715 [Phycisphaerae bacterium]|nr:hypothetical protein [Phycisphaerae bacterium]
MKVNYRPKQTHRTIGVIGVFVLVMATCWYVLSLCNTPQPVIEKVSIRAKVIELQNLVKAKPDGKIGRETMEKVNTAVDRELANEYADVYMHMASGEPNGKSD